MIRSKEFRGIAQITPHSFLGFLLLLSLAGSPEWLHAQDNFELGIRAYHIAIENQNESSDTIRIQQLDPLQVQATSLERDLRTIGQYSNLVSKKWLEWQNFGHLGEVAQAFSSAYVQTNGPGSLALIAQRGLSSSRTQLIWRGFGLNHPMLGVTDVSLLSSELFDGVVFSPGLGNSRYGQTGAGSVHLLHELGNERSDIIQYSLGSFGTRKWSLGVGNTTEKTRWDLRFHESTATNDFLYQKKVFDPAQQKIVQKSFRREHNETEKRAMMMMVSHVLSSQWDYESALWLYEQENQIPGSISAPSPNASQEDGFIRWVQKISGGKQNRWELSHFYQAQQLDYRDLDKRIASDSNIQSHILRVNHQSYSTDALLIQSRVEGGYFRVQSSDYRALKDRYYAAHYQSLIFRTSDKLLMRLEAKQQWQSDASWHWTASAGIEYRPISRSVIFVQSGKQTVIPTFNDLYWPVYGNPNLKPEDVWSLEGGLKWNLFDAEMGTSVWDLNAHLGYYYNHINDGIRWLPDDQGQSRPSNIESLTSQGVEWSLDVEATFGQWSWLLRSGVYQTMASIDKARYPNDPALGKQLRYTPEWQFKHHSRLAFRRWAWVVSHQHVGQRYSSADHSSPFDPLNSFGEWNTSLSWSPRVLKRELLFQIEVKNVLDQKYQQVLHYPMPGRHLYARIQIKQFQPEKNTYE